MGFYAGIISERQKYLHVTFIDFIKKKKHSCRTKLNRSFGTCIKEPFLVGNSIYKWTPISKTLVQRVKRTVMGTKFGIPTVTYRSWFDFIQEIGF